FAGGTFLGMPLWWWALVIPVTVGVVGILGILAWIGWTMATTPPPKPIEFEEPKSETSEAGQTPAASEAASGQEKKKA
ncbi:MAG: phage holin family protein, partial [Candidatus Bathyarchaeia archaeon]